MIAQAANPGLPNRAPGELVRTILALILVAGGGTGCADSTSPAVAAAVAAVTITPSVATLEALDDSVQLRAIAVDPTGAPIEGTTFNWISSDDAVVSVSPAGVVTALGDGLASVTASVGGQTGSSRLTVRQVARSLEFAQQPSLGPAGVPFSPAVAVALIDANGWVVSNSSDVVSVLLDANPTGGVLRGTGSVAAVSGIATFDEIFVDRAGSGYQLTAGAGSVITTSIGFARCLARTEGLVGWWPGENDAADATGSHDGSLAGRATFEEGKVDRAFAFAGVGDFMSVPDHPSLDLQNLTIAAWINPVGHVSEDDPVVTVGADTGIDEGGYALEFAGSDLTFSIHVATHGPRRTNGVNIPLGQWSHVVATYGDAVMRLYVNGVLGSDRLLDGPIQSSGRELRLAGDPRNPGARGFDGLIDEVAIFRRSLNSLEVRLLFEAGSAGMCK
jgi:hypothetical protein